jgi:hypothetical protein
MSVIGMVLGVISLVVIILAFTGILALYLAFIILGVIVFVKVGVKIRQNALLK